MAGNGHKLAHRQTHKHWVAQLSFSQLLLLLLPLLLLQPNASTTAAVAGVKENQFRRSAQRGRGRQTKLAVYDSPIAPRDFFARRSAHASHLWAPFSALSSTVFGVVCCTCFSTRLFVCLLAFVCLRCVCARKRAARVCCTEEDELTLRAPQHLLPGATLLRNAQRRTVDWQASRALPL